MKGLSYFFSITFAFFFANHTSAQSKRDYHWIIGYDQVSPQDDAISLNFNFCPVKVSSISTDYGFSMEGSNTSMSDEDGNLLFYSNGCYIVDAEGEIMENGDTINPGLIQNNWCPSGGSPWTQGIISIPAPGSDSLYYVFNLDMDLPYFMMDTFIGIAPERLYYDVIDSKHSSGLGKVIVKNQIAVQDTFGRGNIQAIKHANGVDWWIITPKSHSNCYFLTLVTSQGIQPSFLECEGKIWNDNDTQGQSVFTPDGKKFIRFNPWNGLNIYDFDNETGSLSNPIYIEFPNDPLTFHVAGVAVSPNSRYLYAMALKNAYQFDLKAQDIAASKVLIAEWDGYSNPYPTIFYLAALAPNNKIYIAGTSSHKFLHVIHNPDSSGIKCGFEQRGLSLPSYNFATIPNFPQYRNGPTDMGCDSMVNINGYFQTRPSIKIYPNPTKGLFSYRISETQSTLYIEVYDIFGRKRLSKRIENLDDSVDLEDFEEGIYILIIKSEKSSIWKEKLVKIK